MKPSWFSLQYLVSPTKGELESRGLYSSPWRLRPLPLQLAPQGVLVPKEQEKAKTLHC